MPQVLAGARVGLLALAIAVLPVSAPGTAQAGARTETPRPQLTVMTQNLYLGSPLTPALDPRVDTPEEFVAAVAQIYGTALATDFPTRAGAIADTIAQEAPDLIGLQEVTKWVATATQPGPTPVSQNFLRLLRTELAERGMHYEVAAVAHNADIGPAPLVAPAFGCVDATDCIVTLKDRDVILVNADTRGLRWSRPRSGHYDAQQAFTPPGSAPVSFARGWATVKVTYRGEELRFANTHLEVAGFPEVQEDQALEFVTGPARARKAVVAVGDFNSAADRSTTDSYELLIAALRDTWSVNPDDPGWTSGQNGTLSNETSQLRQRIDLILKRSSCRTRVRVRDAHVVGDAPFQEAAPLWSSDHAGVVATLKLR